MDLEAEVRRLQYKVADQEREIRRLRGEGRMIRLMGDIDMQGHRILNLGAPLRAYDAAHRQQTEPTSSGAAAVEDPILWAMLLGA